MKVVTRAELIKLPTGTIYSHWEPCIATGLYVHGGSLEVDWYEASLLPVCHDPPDSPPVFDPENDFGRNGMFRESDTFAVYEPDDINKLIGILLDTFKAAT